MTPSAVRIQFQSRDWNRGHCGDRGPELEGHDMQCGKRTDRPKWPTQSGYGPSLSAVCPTCHAVDQARIALTPWNLIKMIASVPLWVFPGTDFFLIRLHRRCKVCGARFRPRALVADPCCWKCGYSLRGLLNPRCPECGTVFPAFVLNGAAVRNHGRAKTEK